MHKRATTLLSGTASDAARYAAAGYKKVMNIIYLSLYVKSLRVYVRQSIAAGHI
jgi:hypothetical protein